MRSRRYSVAIAVGVFVLTTLIVTPFIHHLSIEFRDSVIAIHGHIRTDGTESQGLHRSHGTVWAMSGPRKCKRLSARIGDVALYVDVLREVTAADEP